MSWWVKEIESITDDNLYRLCYIEADDTTLFPAPVQQKEVSDPDNPGQTIWVTDYTIVRGSKLYCLSNASWYKLNSSGQWILQTTGGGGGASSADQVSYDNTDSGLTATNVQNAIDEIKDLDDMQDRELAELYGEDANQQLEINYAINTGSKNFLKITANSQTIKGVTFTVNDDQTVTVNGTNDGTGASTFVIVPNAQAITIPDGNYILSGCPTGGGESAPFDLRWYMYSPGKSAYDSGNGASIEKSGNGTGSNIAIVVKTGQTAHNITFKPMIRRAEITDSTYVPYAPTNRELYELCETKASLNDIYGIKNQLPNGTNLNDLTAGCMTCPGATVAASLLNCPTTTDAFIIYTDYLAAASRAIQRIYSFSTTTGIPAQYMRVRWSQGWTPWYQVTMQSVASVQSLNSPMTLNLDRNDLNEQLDSNFDLIDSIPEEEEGEEDV